MSASNTTTDTMQKCNINSSINNLDSYFALVSALMDNIMNCVKLHIALSRYNPL